jgi:TRAP-type C4-dicarboxylate transport system substrate-binding protein
MHMLKSLGAGLALSLSICAAAAQEIKLTFADQNSATGWGPVHAMQPWIKQVEQATKGRVKIEVFSSQTLLKGPDTWRGVSTGIADMGWCVQAYWPDLTPLAEVIQLPGLPMKSAEHGSEAMWKLYEKFPSIQREFSAIQPLIMYTTHPYFIFTAKKQVKTMEDLKGLKIRVIGGPATDQMKAFGAVPTPMPMPDVYQALDKGVIDGMGAPWEAIEAFRLYEVAKYYTMVPLSAVNFSVCANKQKWQSLPGDVRDQIMSVSGLEGSKFWGKNYFDSAEAEVVAKAKAANAEMVRYTPPAEELAKFSKVGGQPLWDEWVKKMEGKGQREARAVLDATLEFLK